MAQVFGLPIDDLPDGWEPVEALVIVKCLRPEEDGYPYGLTALATDGLSVWEAEGMLRWAARTNNRDDGDGEDCD
ncbi:MAG TPA: hypothetical protein VK020_06815 [Microlunatus sp.]|nr:hypothetical protein [Microlunatus sp.]